MSLENAANKYEELFGKVNESLGFNLKVYFTRTGIIVEKYYSRNDFHCELEDKVLFHANGKVYRDNKEVKTPKL